MSLLDDAKRLAETGPAPQDWFRRHNKGIDCLLCGVFFWNDDDEHRRGCPTRALSRIVAVLEAAERVAGMEPFAGTNSMEAGVCGFCGRERIEDHPSDCPWQALVAALQRV